MGKINDEKMQKENKPDEVLGSQDTKAACNEAA